MKRSNKYSNTSSVLGSFSESRWRSDPQFVFARTKKRPPWVRAVRFSMHIPNVPITRRVVYRSGAIRCSLSRVNEARFGLGALALRGPIASIPIQGPLRFNHRGSSCGGAYEISDCGLHIRHRMSALPPKADIAGRDLDVRFVPTTEVEITQIGAAVSGMATEIKCRSALSGLQLARQ
jgi:hypothetical protein